MVKEFVYSGYTCSIVINLDYRTSSRVITPRFHWITVTCLEINYRRSTEIEDKYLSDKIKSEETNLKKAIDASKLEDPSKVILKKLGFV